MNNGAVNHSDLLQSIEALREAINSRVSYRQFVMIVGGMFALLGAAYSYHDMKRWHDGGSEVVVGAARDAHSNIQAVAELREGQSRIESKVDEIRGYIRGNHGNGSHNGNGN